MRRLGAYVAASTGNPYGEKILGAYQPAAFPLPTVSPRYSFGPVATGSGLGQDADGFFSSGWFWLGLGIVALAFAGAIPLPRRPR